MSPCACQPPSQPLSVKLRGVVPKPQPATPSAETGGVPEPASRRPVHFGGGVGYVDTPVYRRETLAAGTTLEGPAVIEQLDSTVILPPGTRSEVTADLHIVMKFL